MLPKLTDRPQLRDSDREKSGTVFMPVLLVSVSWCSELFSSRIADSLILLTASESSCPDREYKPDTLSSCSDLLIQIPIAL